MTCHDSHERELRDILIAANCGEASIEQLQELDHLIRQDPKNARYAARLLDQQAALAWTSDRNSQRELARADSKQQFGTSQRLRPIASLPVKRRLSIDRGSLVAAALISFVVGSLTTFVVSRDWAENSRDIAGVAILPEQDRAYYQARLVRSTACLWQGEFATTHTVDRGVTSGETLNLLEGVAEFDLNWLQAGSAEFSLEGPAAMVLSSQGMPILHFGRLTASIRAGRRPFELETSTGRLLLRDAGSIGISAFGSEAEIHVFDGSAEFEPAWLLDPDQRSHAERIESGESIRIRANEFGQLVITRQAADKAFFAAELSMASDPLIIPPSYVEAIKKASPIGYWRFERETWPEIPNEMGAGLTCHLEGRLGIIGNQLNQSLEFGVTDPDGRILSSDVLDRVIRDQYSIEFWIKPSHYHVGAVVSLVGQPEVARDVDAHGMLVELGGAGRIPTAVHHPGRIRFLHRYPASDDTQLGTSCYSTEAYSLRRWQHVVAVKDGTAMRLYVNGRLVGEDADDSQLPPGLRLLVGQLYPTRRVRPYIGQLDELALYDRALTSEEVQAHYLLVRPVATDGSRI